MFSDPFIELGGENRIEVNFDAFNPGFGRYAYNLVHCNADWTQSNLSPIEYMNGFQGSTIEDFANAMGTTVQYTNYRLLFPNDDVQPKVSGIMPCKYITRMIPPRSYLPHAFLFLSRWLVSPLRWAEIRISIPISHTNKSALRSITKISPSPILRPTWKSGFIRITAGIMP